MQSEKKREKTKPATVIVAIWKRSISQRIHNVLVCEFSFPRNHFSFRSFWFDSMCFQKWIKKKRQKSCTKSDCNASLKLKTIHFSSNSSVIQRHLSIQLRLVLLKNDLKSQSCLQKDETRWRVTDSLTSSIELAFFTNRFDDRWLLFFRNIWITITHSCY